MRTNEFQPTAFFMWRVDPEHGQLICFHKTIDRTSGVTLSTTRKTCRGGKNVFYPGLMHELMSNKSE